MFIRKKSVTSFPGVPFHDASAPEKAAPQLVLRREASPTSSPEKVTRRKRRSLVNSHGLFSGFDSGSFPSGHASESSASVMAYLSPRRNKRSSSVVQGDDGAEIAELEAKTGAKLEELVDKQAAKLRDLQFEELKVRNKLRKLEHEANTMRNLKKTQRSNYTSLKVHFGEEDIEFGERLNTSLINCHEVYACSVAGLRMAVKRNNKERCTPREAEALTKEAAIMRLLPPHRHVIRYFFDMEVNGLPHLFIELRAGTVHQFISELNKRDERLRPDVAIMIARHAALGLRAIHAAGILHRDIKSDNLFVNYSEDGSISSVAVGDFDVSYCMTDNDPPTDVIGTSTFMAAEVLADEAYGYPADIYSYGCMLFELITGHVPWMGIAGVTQRVLLGERPDVAELIQLLNPTLYGLFLRCTEKDPEDRPSLDNIIDTLVAAEEHPSCLADKRAPLYRLSQPSRKVST